MSSDAYCCFWLRRRSRRLGSRLLSWSMLMLIWKECFFGLRLGFCASVRLVLLGCGLGGSSSRCISLWARWFGLASRMLRSRLGISDRGWFFLGFLLGIGARISRKNGKVYFFLSNKSKWNMDFLEKNWIRNLIFLVGIKLFIFF